MCSVAFAVCCMSIIAAFVADFMMSVIWFTPGMDLRAMPTERHDIDGVALVVGAVLSFMVVAAAFDMQ